ncbi:hypothetical protein D5F01_LYC21096 [Larimichthys crocea]|uniref:Peptidase A2 domain-containing protein n=1 Tax=Larimichthys crocea TaxID=215358 RepID=A0A6G0HMV7_LARCR|nr:hypothetical protein D5F01_LYC21096 [Larimichthys crocea]
MKYKRKDTKRENKVMPKASVLLVGTETRPTDETARGSLISQGPKKFCPFCDNNKHSLNNCANFKFLNSAQKRVWIQDNNRCWRCGRNHRAAERDLKMCCKTCNNRHLLALHEISGKTPAKADKPTPAVSGPVVPTLPNRTEEVLYIGKPPQGQRVLLKVSKVVLMNGDQTLETYAILDDGSERTLLLHSAAKQLGLQGEPENLPLRTVRQDPQTLHGAAISFTISPASSPHQVFLIMGAFTAPQLGLGEHTYPVRVLKCFYVDNCLQSVTTKEDARALVDQLQTLLSQVTALTPSVTSLPSAWLTVLRSGYLRANPTSRNQPWASSGTARPIHSPIRPELL